MEAEVSSLDHDKPLVFECTSLDERRYELIDEDNVQETEMSDNRQLLTKDVLWQFHDNHGDVQAFPPPPVFLQSMRSHIPSPCFTWVAPSTPEAVDSTYRYNSYSTNYEEIKNDITMHTAEFELTLMAESPEEAARVLPRCLPSNILPQKSKAMAKASDELSAPSLPTYEGELKKTMFPHLLAATYYDFSYIPLGNQLNFNMLQKAYSILRELKIATDNPFLIVPEDLIPPQSSYRMGIFNYRPYIGLRTVYPIGKMGAIQELYCIDDNSRQIWPLRALVKANSAYIKPCFLPHWRYSLFGLEKVLYSNAEPIVVTPDLTEYFINNSYEKAVISWYGAQYTLPKVDFSPLAGRTVVYVFNPGSFNGDINACSQCMNQVMLSLQAQGCKVNIMGNPAFANQINLPMIPPCVCTENPVPQYV